MRAENLENLYMRNGQKINENTCKEQGVLETQRTWEDYSKINTVCVYIYIHTHTHIQIFFFCGSATQRGSWPPHS